MTDFKLLLMFFYIQSFCVSFTVNLGTYDTEEIIENIGRETTASTSEELKITTSSDVTGDTTLPPDETTETIESTEKTTRVNKYERSVPKPITDFIKKQRLTRKDEAVEFIDEKNSTVPLCPFFIYSAGFDLEKMADVWQSVYYKMPHQLACFKILLRKTSQEERSENEKRYSNFNKQMNWKECLFEVRSSTASFKKHYLQGGVADMGVMRNIVLVRDKNDEFKLEEESPDQWLMLRGLLFLRDCDTGGMVAFTRVPHRPRTEDIQEALYELGEEMTGELLCEDPW